MRLMTDLMRTCPGPGSGMGTSSITTLYLPSGFAARFISGSPLAGTSRYETTDPPSARASGYGRCARSFQILAADWYLAASSVWVLPVGASAKPEVNWRSMSAAWASRPSAAAHAASGYRTPRAAAAGTP